MSEAYDLLRRLSYWTEKLFRQRGALRSYLWMTEADGHQTIFETGCDGDAPDTASDRDLLDALRDTLRAEFTRDGVVRYGIAFAGHQVTVFEPPTPQLRVPCIALEVHDAAAHLRSHREIIHVGGTPRLAALAPVEAAIRRAAVTAQFETWVLTEGIASMQAAASHLYVCSGEPTTFEGATVTYMLGFKSWGAGNCLTGPVAGINPVGMKVSTVPIAD